MLHLFLNSYSGCQLLNNLRLGIATVVFECLNDLAPSYLSQKFKTRSGVHNCNTTNRHHVPLSRTAVGQRAFTFRGQKLWNLDVFNPFTAKGFPIDE